MTVLTAFVPSLVAALSIFIVAWLSKGRFEAIDTNFTGVREDIKEMRVDVREMRDDIRQVRGELAGLRSDLTHVALAVGAKTRPETA